MMRRTRNRTPEIRLGKFYFPLLFFLFLAVFLIIFLKAGVFNVKKVIVEGCEATSCNDVASQIEKDILNKIIFTVKVSELKNSLLSSGYYSNVSVEKLLPSTMKIKVKEFSVRFCLYDEESEIQVDENGHRLKAFPNCPPTASRFRYSVESVKKAEQVDISQLKSAEIVRNYLLSKEMGVREVEIKAFGVIELNFEGELKGIFSSQSKRDIETQAVLFYEVYKAIAKEGKHLSSIDVRFDKVVVKYAK
uniref:FtsQ-type POTRA domain-containing protein n=1 Tax=candidate division CPR3 bacterium TaxID=2268181 RepID=A0A7C5YXC6_UNCC3